MTGRMINFEAVRMPFEPKRAKNEEEYSTYYDEI